MASYDEVKGCITMGPKDNHLYRIPVTYIPTEEQIRNLREFFGWDFIKEGEDEL